MEALQRKINMNVARNVILFVGDGMGLSTVTAARILRGQRDGKPGEETKLTFERFPNIALAKVNVSVTIVRVFHVFNKRSLPKSCFCANEDECKRTIGVGVIAGSVKRIKPVEDTLPTLLCPGAGGWGAREWGSCGPSFLVQSFLTQSFLN